jgi:hypothetical protein
VFPVPIGAPISPGSVSAVIPLALVALALFGVLHLSSLWTDHVGPWIEARTSIPLYTVIDDTVSEILLRKEGFWLTAGRALTIWELSSAVRAVMEALDRIYEARGRRPWARRMLVSLALGAGAGALLLAAFVVLALGEVLTGTGGVSLCGGCRSSRCCSGRRSGSSGAGRRPSAGRSSGSASGPRSPSWAGSSRPPATACG